MKKNGFYRFWNKLLLSLGWWELGCLENSFFPRGFRIRRGSRPHSPRGHSRFTGRTWIGMGILVLTYAFTAQVTAQDLTPNQRWIEQVDGGFVFPASKAANKGYAAGLGGDILVGYRFNRDFSLAADLGYYDCDEKAGGATAGEWLYTPLMALGRFNIGSGWFRPFLLLGVGLAFNNYTFTPALSAKLSTQDTDFFLSPGAGILFVVANNMALYVQGRVDIDFTPLGGLGTPLTDSPMIFIPLKAGLSFFVL